MSNHKQRKTSLPAGFGGSFSDDEGDVLSLDKLLVQTPTATYFFNVSGDNSGGKLENGDVAVVDRSLTPVTDDFIIAIVESEFVIRRIEISKDSIKLYRDSDVPSEVFKEGELEIFGVITASITRHRKFKL